MTAVRATFDGSRIILPPGTDGHRPGTVIVIFEEVEDRTESLPAVAQEPAFAKVWDNDDDDAAYDDL